MESNEKLGGYLKEIPIERPSVDFTQQVMNRVRLEPVKVNTVYQPLISWQVWLRVIVGLLMAFLGALLFYSYMPADPGLNGLISFDKIDFSMIIKPFELLTQTLNKLSFTYIVIFAAISVLLLIDQLYTRYTDR